MIKLVYEFIGTFFLVLTVGMTVISPGAGPLAPVAIGSILAVMVYAGGNISGGHYNPAVSLAIYLRGKLTSRDLGGYWFSQLAAAVVAAYTVLYFKGAPQLIPIDLDSSRVFLAEFLFTFALAYVVLNVATTSKSAGNSYYGGAIGFTVLAGAYAVGTVSGAAFNPAVALGACVMSLTMWSQLWVFMVATMLGGAVAATVFKAAHPHE